jgi:hypothetical protein
MPTLMRKMLLLTWSHMNVLPLRIRQRIELGRFRGVGMDPHSREIKARKTFQTYL